MKNRIEIESAITSMEDVALCIKLVDDMIAEGTKSQQVQAVEILSEIFKARYSALTACIHGDQPTEKGSF